MPRKETRRKGGRKNGSGQKAKPSNPTQATDESMGEEEKNRNRRKNKKKKQGMGPNLTTRKINIGNSKITGRTISEAHNNLGCDGREVTEIGGITRVLLRHEK